MIRWTIAACAAALVLSQTAIADTRETQLKTLERYTPYLQAPVEQFQFWSLYKWQQAGPDNLVVWTTIKEAYLLTVEQPCSKLEWARAIGVTSQQNHYVTKRTDYVTADGDRCRITAIQPIDYARMQKENEGNAGAAK